MKSYVRTDLCWSDPEVVYLYVGDGLDSEAGHEHLVLDLCLTQADGGNPVRGHGHNEHDDLDHRHPVREVRPETHTGMQVENQVENVKIYVNIPNFNMQIKIWALNFQDGPGPK